MSNEITKQEWLDGAIMVDTYGRKPGLADVPLTTMTRKQSFDKQRSFADYTNFGFEKHFLFLRNASKVYF